MKRIQILFVLAIFCFAIAIVLTPHPSAMAQGGNPGAGASWSLSSAPAASSQATASQAAVSGWRHVADSVCFSGGATTAPALTQLSVNLRDGASGAGNVLKSWTVIIPAATGQAPAPLCVSGLSAVGSNNTAMTIEFSAGLTNLFENVNATGHDIPQ